MTFGWYRHKYWEPVDDTEDLACTVEEMQQAVHGIISTEILYLNDPKTVTIANVVMCFSLKLK